MASQDHTVRIWAAATHQPVTPPMWHMDAVMEATFTPDGHRLVTLTSQGSLRMWDATTGEAITTSLEHPHGHDLGHMMFSPDGHRLLVTAGGAGPSIREFKRNRFSVEFLIEEAEILSGHHLGATDGIVPLDVTALSRNWLRLHPQTR